jgi:hypothetical protein
VKLHVSWVANLEAHNYQRLRGLRPAMHEIYSYMGFNRFNRFNLRFQQFQLQAKGSQQSGIKILQLAFHDLGFSMQ